jgi:ABC-type dipeptide/oligopeptide/nickel transport system permease component
VTSLHAVQATARRLAFGAAAVFGASVLSFIALRLLPGNPARVILGPMAPASAVRAETVALGLTRPVYSQYFTYISDFFRGNWGYSYSNGAPVLSLFGQRIWATVELALFAFVFALVGAVLLALVTTYRRRPVLDGAVRGISLIGLGTPPFWLGLVLLLVFFSRLGWFPAPGGRLSPADSAPPSITHLYTLDALLTGRWYTLGDALRHLVLPAVTLGLAPLGFLAGLLRANLLDASREPYVTFARSKGLGRWLAFIRHVLPNAFLPTLTASSIIFVQLLTGSVLVENVFGWPGIGQLILQAIVVQDFAVVEAFIFMAAVAYVAVNTVVDILYGIIDPRVRTAPGAGR